MRPLPSEIAICRASLLEHAVLLRGVYERLPATALSRDARENTCARFLSAILEGGELTRWSGWPPVNPSAQSGDLAILLANLRASSLLSSLAAERRPGSLS